MAYRCAPRHSPAIPTTHPHIIDSSSTDSPPLQPSLYASHLYTAQAKSPDELRGALARLEQRAAAEGGAHLRNVAAVDLNLGCGYRYPRTPTDTHGHTTDMQQIPMRPGALCPSVGCGVSLLSVGRAAAGRVLWQG